MSNSKHYIWLFGLSALAVFYAADISNWSKNILSLIEFLPYLIIIFGMFISLFMNRFLPILLLGTIGILNLASSYYLPVETISVSAVMLSAILPLLLPINLMLWAWLPEKGIYNSFYNLSLAIVFLIQIVIVYYFMVNLPINFVAMLNTGADIKAINLPILVVVAIILSWLLMVLRNAYLERIDVIDKAIIFVLLLLVFGLNQLQEPYVFSWLSSVSALLIVLSIIFGSHKIAYTDQLTGLGSRRALLEYFLSLGKTYSIAMMDIDHFKKFNDTYGHDVGDKVLKMVANELGKISTGNSYRYGGEEFTVVFPKKTAKEVMGALEEVRANIENLVLNVDNKGKQKVTVSFGLAEKESNEETPEEVLKYADEALYKAKEKGRNRVEEY